MEKKVLKRKATRRGRFLLAGTVVTTIWYIGLLTAFNESPGCEFCRKLAAWVSGDGLIDQEVFKHGSSIPAHRKPTIWFIWLGSREMSLLHESAVESCRKSNQDFFEIRIVKDADLLDAPSSLGFDLHPAFHLLDPVQKSDYLRQEILHHHGGIYLDVDVFCLSSFAAYIQSLQTADGGGSPQSGNLNNNMLGPFRKKSKFTTACREALWARMDELEPQLRECALNHPDGRGGIAYPSVIKALDPQLCGTSWGELIDLNQKRTLDAYKKGSLVHTFKRCNPSSRFRTCDVLHVGCAGESYDCDSPSTCKAFPILRQARLCNEN